LYCASANKQLQLHGGGVGTAGAVTVSVGGLERWNNILGKKKDGEIFEGKYP